MIAVRPPRHTLYAAPMARVRFLADDRFGLWDAGDLATDFGRESIASGAPCIHVLVLDGTEEEITLHDPYGRGLVERIDDSE